MLCCILHGGMTNPEIARKYYLTENSVKTILRRLFRKTGTVDRIGLVIAVLRGEIDVCPALPAELTQRRIAATVCTCRGTRARTAGVRRSPVSTT